MPDVIRAFIAVEINDAIREGLTVIQDELNAAGGHVSWVKPQNIHCTLVFLGDIFQPEVAAVANTLSDAATGCKPFEIEISGLGFFGSPRSPRIIWAGMAGAVTPLVKLQNALVTAVLAAGLKPDLKPFNPHLTIGRVRSKRNAAALLHALEKNRDKAFGVMAVSQLVLMESRLASTGPVYSSLCAAALGG